MKTISLLTGILLSINLISAQSLDYKIYLNNGTCTENITYDPGTNYWYSTNNTHNSPQNESIMFTWQFVQTPVTSSITGIFFTDSLNGWASHANMGGLRTTNSGFNWDVISFNDTTFSASFFSTCFINSGTGWMVGGALQIRKTTNGGINWFRQNVPPIAGILRSVYFIDANTGFAAGSKNFPWVPCIIKSTNGGTSWTEITLTSSGQELYSQYWFNANTGWFSGYDFLMKTTNGGTNFINYFPNLPPTGNGHSVILSITWVNEVTGYVGAANLERNNIYKTTNSGTNWVFQNNPITQNGWNQMNDIKFISPDSGWAAHGTPTTGGIIFTSNGGTNWVMDNPQNYWYMCLAKYQKAKVWSGSSTGKVWWINIQEPVGISNNGSAIPDENILYQNYPNPFNPKSKIKYQISKTQIKNQKVNLSVYNSIGQMITVLVNQLQESGIYEIEWDAINYPSGVYFYTLHTEEYTVTKKMMLIR